MRETQSAHGSEESDTSYEDGKTAIPVRRKNIKRILLTRRYRDSDVYSDLGIHITGGKKLHNGELGAFVSAVNKERACETLGEVKEGFYLGDQVLECNGVILTGKTFEEVERIINGSQGEIELVVKSGGDEYDGSREKKQKTRGNNNYEIPHSNRKRSEWSARNDDLDGRLREAPPIPTHRCVDGRASPSFDVYPSLSVHSDPAPAKPVTKTYRSSGNDPHSLGYINIAVSYNYRSSALRVTILSARGLSYRQHSSKTFYPNPFVKIYLLPGREVCNKRRTKFVSNTADPVWNQIVEYNIPLRDLRSHYLEFTVWDYDRLNDNNSLGQVIISLSEPSLLDGKARWYPLQSMHNNFAVTGLPSSHFQNVIGNYTNNYVQNTYNPGDSQNIL
uniref:C2 domain-containing protein n=1 Tax=Syphacia muris TaxID=451379 RepID=A0A0N5AA04_9BILA